MPIVRYLTNAQLARIEEQLEIELRIRSGAENMLQLYTSKGDPNALKEVQLQLDSVNAKIGLLQRQFDSYKNQTDPRAHLICVRGMMR